MIIVSLILDFLYTTIDLSIFTTFLVNDLFSTHPITISDRIPDKTIFTQPPPALG